MDMDIKEEEVSIQNVIINENSFQDSSFQGDDEIYYYSTYSNDYARKLQSSASVKKKDFDYLYSLDDQETVENLLRRWNFEPAIPKFREEQIDLFTMKFLIDRDVAEKLFKDYPMSVWLKFYNKLNIWKNQNFQCFDEASVTSNRSQTITKEYSNEIEDILRSTQSGFNIIKYYEENHRLDPNHQDQLINLVCDELLTRGRPVSTGDFLKMSNEIKELFPNESREFYFIPRSAAEQTRGKLFNKYNNRLKRYRETHDLRSSTKRLKTSRDPESNQMTQNFNATPSRIIINEDPRDFNRIEGILKSSTTGLNILNYYEANNKLEAHHQDSLVTLVIDYLVDKRKLVSASEFLEYADEIKSLFPTENREYYFLPRFENENGVAKGRLYTKYYNRVKKLRENNEFPKKNSIQKSVFAAKKSKSQPSPYNTLKPLTIEQDSDEISGFDLASLKCEFSSEDKNWSENSAIVEKWKLTSESRLQYIKRLKSDKLQKILELWSPFLHNRGHELVDIDFDVLFPGKLEILIQNWSKIKSKLYSVLISTNKNKSVKDLLSDYSTALPNIQDLILFLALHSVLFNYGRIKYLDENNEPKFWKYTISDSQSAFFLHCNDENSIKNLIETRKIQYTQFQMDLNPVIVGTGSDFASINKFHVIYGDICYSFDQFIYSVDTLFKLLKIFNLKYSAECQVFFNFIQKLLYNIHLESDPINCQVERLASQLN